MIGARLTIDGDMLSENKCRSMSFGNTLLKRLKELSTIHALDTGFTKSSMKTYRPILKTAGWIKVVGSMWIWTGPDDADWSTVTQARRPKKAIKHPQDYLLTVPIQIAKILPQSYED
jgi:hypothetical protein